MAHALRDRVVVGTGASPGIGRATALAFGAPGAAVVLLMGQIHGMKAAPARRAGR